MEAGPDPARRKGAAAASLLPAGVRQLKKNTILREVAYPDFNVKKKTCEAV